MKFHERFNIDIGIADVQRRFMNRVKTIIIDEYLDSDDFLDILERLEKMVALFLGEPFEDCGQIEVYYSNDYYKCLNTLEIIYSSLLSMDKKHLANKFSNYIESIVKLSEVDLGIEWKSGAFYKKGAQLLDDKLINDSLGWISIKRYQSVYKPFSNGLKHFIESERNPVLLKSVITEMYEALEALSKIVTNRDTKDLSANKDLFLKNINAAEEYKSILKEYIAYANKFRHSDNEVGVRPELNTIEVESFIYLTGLFIRLCIASGSNAN